MLGTLGSVVRRLSRITEWALLPAGLALFAWMLHHMGVGLVVENIRLVGWRIALIVLQEGIAYFCNALGWWYAFAPPRPAIPFHRLLAVRLAGDSINYVTPTANVGGEFVRVRLLSDRVPVARGVRSVAIAMLNQTIAQAVFIVLGLGVALRGTALPPAMVRGLLISAAVMSAVALLLLVMPKRGLLAAVQHRLRALGLSSPEDASDACPDSPVSAYRAPARPGFVSSTACFLAGWMDGLIEVTLMLYFLGVPLTLERVVVIEVISTTVDALLFFVPGKLGTQEGSKVLAFTILGLDPAQGLSFAILRRIRELTWAAIGLVVLSRLQRGRRAAAHAR
jgi:glycosyltransferase 2 family protein